MYEQSQHTGSKKAYFKIGYLQNYLVNFQKTDIVGFRMRCKMHIQHLITIEDIDFLTISRAME